MNSFQLRGGHRTGNPLLGRVPEFDERSRAFGVRELLPPVGLVSKTWQCRLLLDQGIRLSVPKWDPSACTGFSSTYDLAAYPQALKQSNGAPFNNEFAFSLYQLAKTLDEWAGESYEGSSVLGAAKALQKLGFIGEYRWAFGIDDMLAALSHIGPVVTGTDWQTSQFGVRPSGLVLVEGGPSETEGGHAYMARGVLTSATAIKRYMKGERIRVGIPLVRYRQSWGAWGLNNTGDFFMWADDVEKLLKGITSPGDARVTTTAFHR
jgi:hypothetical protein